MTRKRMPIGHEKFRFGKQPSRCGQDAAMKLEDATKRRFQVCVR